MTSSCIFRYNANGCMLFNKCWCKKQLVSWSDSCCSCGLRSFLLLPFLLWSGTCCQTPTCNCTKSRKKYQQMISGFTYSSSCVSGYSESRNETRGHPFSKKQLHLKSRTWTWKCPKVFSPFLFTKKISSKTIPFFKLSLSCQKNYAELPSLNWHGCYFSLKISSCSTEKCGSCFIYPS